MKICSVQYFKLRAGCVVWQGELCVKTPQLMVGLKGGEGSSCTDPEGFFHTGDLGFYDRDGIIHFMEQVTCTLSTVLSFGPQYLLYIDIQRGYFKTNLNVGIDSENRVGKRVAHAP